MQMSLYTESKHVIGADGVLQAMTLSYGALKFSNHHLEFGTHPRDLHRDYFFRRINYGNDTHVNISVQVGDDNKAVLYVSLDRNNRPYYACDAGCLDAPEPLRYSVFYGTWRAVTVLCVWNLLCIF